MKRLFTKNSKGFLSVLHHPLLLLWISAAFALVIVIKAAGLGVTYINASLPSIPDTCLTGWLFGTGGTNKFFFFIFSASSFDFSKYFFASFGSILLCATAFFTEMPPLINGKWYKVGDKVGDAEIMAIEPTQVKIKWDGKEKFFAPLAAASAKEPKKEVKKPTVKKVKNKEVEATQKVVVEKAPAAPQEEDPLAWMGVTLSAKVRAKILETWNTLTEEQKEQFKEQWNSMTDEQKQQTVDAMEQNL